MGKQLTFACYQKTMETAGLAVGIAGLAGLFSSCVEAIEKVQAYMSFEADSEILETRFRATKASFERWGQEVGIADGKLDESNGGHSNLSPDDKSLNIEIENLLKTIRTLCHEGDHPSSPKQPRQDGVLLHREPLAKFGGQNDGPALAIRTSKRRKLMWALWDKGKRTEKVNDLEKLVKHLHILAPATGAAQRLQNEQPELADLKKIIRRIEDGMASKFTYN